MSIVKNTPNFLKHAGQSFTTLINKTMDAIKDPGSLGIYVYLASKPHNWEISVTDIMNRFDRGRDYTRARLAELKLIGLIKTEAIKNSKGQVDHWETTLYNEIQVTENPYSGAENTPKSTLLKIHPLAKPPTTNKRSKKIKESDLRDLPDFNKSGIERIKDFQQDERFMAFYNVYPKHVDPRDAWKAFKSIVGSNDVLLAEILTDVENRKLNHSQWQDKQYIKYPAVYLRKGEYLGEIINDSADLKVKNEQKRLENESRLKEQERLSQQRADEERKNNEAKRKDAQAYRNMTRNGRPQGLSDLLKGMGLR